MGTILYVTAEVIRQISVLCQMVMPDATEKLLDMLAIAPEHRDFSSLGEAGRLSGGTPLLAPTPVFPRYVENKDGRT